MKEVTRIDPVSTAKIAAILGILWAVLGWLFSGVVITLLLQGASEQAGSLPPGFSPGALLSGVIGGVIGGALSGYLGSLVYNWLAGKIGGIRIEVRE